MADSTTAQTPRSHLQCANPVCKFLVHELEEFGGYCCRRCHEHHHKQSTTKSPKHGKLCQQRQAPDGVVRSTPDVPSRPLMELTPQAAARRSHSPRRTRSRGTANQRRREGMPQTHSHRREGRPQTHSHQSVATSGEWSPASTLPYGPHGTPPGPLQRRSSTRRSVCSGRRSRASGALPGALPRHWSTGPTGRPLRAHVFWASKWEEVS